ncbi:MAG TPA: hypothetical protein VH560_09810 [Polyangia bacterium]|jgi:hypothetical protein|nr:hypothetical protein [Polyangia bacterium]
MAMADVGAAPPEVYRLSMEKLPFAVARAQRIAALEALASGTALTALFRAITRTVSSANDAALIIGILTAMAVPYFAWVAGRRVRRHWNAFELAVGYHSVRVAAKGMGRVIIQRDKLAEIIEDADGLVVRSSERGVAVYVPRAVEGFVDARRRLDAWRTIVPRSGVLTWCAASLAAGVVVAATVDWWGTEPGLVTDLLVTDAVAAWVVVLELRRHPHLSPTSQLRATLVIALAALLPLASLLRFTFAG